MLLAFIIAPLSVAIGALVGLVGKNKALSLRPVHTFALSSALLVVLVQLLPEALTDLGIWGLGAFLVALALPALLEWIYSATVGKTDHHHNHHDESHRLGLELAFIGLAAHQMGDGIALGAYVLSAGDSGVSFSVPIAIAAHSIPVTALAIVACRSQLGWKAAAWRSLWLLFATVTGVTLSGLVPSHILEDFGPWVTAAVAGLLIHIVAHDIPRSKPSNTRMRALDFGAVAAALLIVYLGTIHHQGAQHTISEVRTSIGKAWLELTFDTAPTLLVGMLIAAALQLLGSRLPMRWLGKGSSLRQATRGAIIGAPLPICACGVLPITKSLRDRGASAALVVAFLLATPELGIETLALTARFLGWHLAAIRLVAAVAVAIFAALVISRLTGEHRKTEKSLEQTASTPSSPVADKTTSSVFVRFWGHLNELLLHIGPWTVAGLVVAAYVQAVLPNGALYRMASSGVDVLVVTIIAVPSYVCAASATPLAAVLMSKGLSAGAALTALLLGPATNIATVGFLRDQLAQKRLSAAWAPLSCSAG
ncbi:MAG: permease [Myxococcales bacterium]|nr:MAG: permease [Myxococcales bacterium]